jgi:O-antigen/teichoic acid export membrane protein
MPAALQQNNAKEHGVPNRESKPTFAFLAASFAGGSFVSMVIKVFTGVIQGRLVAPGTLGLFSGIGLIVGYAPLLQLGVLSGLNRELPYHVGKGDLNKVNELAAAAQAFALVVGGSFAAVLMGIAIWMLTQSEWLRAAGWLTNAILAVFVFYNGHYLQFTFRTSHDFARLAIAQVVEAVIGFAALLLVAWLNFYGLCLKSVLAGSFGMALLYYWRPIRVGPVWNWADLKHLLYVGAPIYAVGILYAYWTVINSTVILHLAGTEGLGLYVMVAMATASVEFIPSAMVSVFYPRMAEMYGRGEGLSSLLSSIWKPTVVTFVALVPVVAVLWLLVGPAVRMVVPAYAGAVTAMQWGLLLPLVTCFSTVNIIFNVARRNSYYAIAIIVGMAINGCVLMLLVRDGVYLHAFPQAMLAGRVAFILLCYLFAFHITRSKPDAPISA